MVINNPFPEVVIPDIPVVDFVFKHLDKYGDDVAMIDGEDGTYKMTFRQVKDAIINCAKAFVSLGMGRGDLIATCFSNCLEFPIIAIAASVCGAATTTCNPNFTEDEIKVMFNDSKPKIVFIDGPDYEKMKRIAQDVDSIKFIFSMKETTRCTSFKKLLQTTSHEVYSHEAAAGRNDIFLLPYSSGTTGLPKGVMLTQRNFIACAETMKIGIPISRRDSYYLVVPMFHIFGCILSLQSLLQGAKIIVDKRFNVENFLKCVQSHKITSFAAVPPMLLAIYNSPMRTEYDLSSLRSIFCGAAPLPDEVALKVQGALNARLFQAWGLTEGIYTTSAVDSLSPIRSCGNVFPNTQIKIVDVDTEKELGPNESGEIWGKSPMVMKGYYKNPAATANCIDKDGWLHTGDIGYYDKYGTLYIVDRLKELIKYKGFQVAPAELEEVILHHPKVIDVAVIGVSDKEAGEVPKAFIVRKNDLSAEEIHQFIKGKVASYKYLRGGICFRDSIPKSPSGKILRRQLKAMENKSKL